MLFGIVRSRGDGKDHKVGLIKKLLIGPGAHSARCERSGRGQQESGGEDKRVKATPHSIYLSESVEEYSMGIDFQNWRIRKGVELHRTGRRKHQE